MPHRLQASWAVTLTAKANSGSVFGGWAGACSGMALTCSVIVNGANTATANFSTAVSGGGGGGGGGSTTPTGWSGACSTATTPVCTLTLRKALSVKAHFSK